MLHCAFSIPIETVCIPRCVHLLIAQDVLTQLILPFGIISSLHLNNVGQSFHIHTNSKSD